MSSTDDTPKFTRLLTLSETAERLRKTDSQLRWMIHTGSAPKSALIGNRRMFRESDVEDYINAAFGEGDPS